MRDGKLDGMQDFDTVIKEMIERNIVTLEDGLNFATNQNNLLLSLKGLTAAEEFVRRDNQAVPVGSTSDSGSLLGMIE
jgi:Tfp pilus assembly ATPase PilU